MQGKKNSQYGHFNFPVCKWDPGNYKESRTPFSIFASSVKGLETNLGGLMGDGSRGWKKGLLSGLDSPRGGVGPPSERPWCGSKSSFRPLGRLWGTTVRPDRPLVGIQAHAVGASADRAAAPQGPGSEKWDGEADPAHRGAIKRTRVVVDAARRTPAIIIFRMRRLGGGPTSFCPPPPPMGEVDPSPLSRLPIPVIPSLACPDLPPPPLHPLSPRFSPFIPPDVPSFGGGSIAQPLHFRGGGNGWI